MIYINNNTATIIANKVINKIENIKTKHKVALEYFSINDSDFEVYFKMKERDALDRLSLFEKMLDQAVEEHKKAAREAVADGLNNKVGAVDIDLQDQNKFINYFADLNKSTEKKR